MKLAGRCTAVTFGGLLLAASAPVSAQLPSATEVFLNYDHTCTLGPVRACASVQIQSLTTLTGTHLSIRFRNEQGSNWGIDNTGGSSLISFNAWTNDQTLWGSAGDVGENIGFHLDGSVQSLGGPPSMFMLNLWDFGSAFWGVHDADLAITGCDVPYTIHPTEPFAYRAGLRTCQRDSYYGWVVMDFWAPTQFTARDLDYSWNLRVGAETGEGDPRFAVGCDTSNPALCAHTVPEPTTVVLLATGLLALAGFSRRRRGEPESSA